MPKAENVDGPGSGVTLLPHLVPTQPGWGGRFGRGAAIAVSKRDL
jgi:hypothetical protein